MLDSREDLEREKLSVEIQKFMAECRKLNAEAAKLKIESAWYPFAAGAGLVTAIVTLFAVLLKISH